MSHVYVTDSSCKLGLRQGQLVIESKSEGTTRSIPMASVSDISVFGMPQLSTQLVRACLERDISICYYSDDGHYFGHISSSTQLEPFRQKRQIYLTDDPGFCLAWSKLIVKAKILNSLVLLGSYPQVHVFNAQDVAGLLHSLENIDTAESVSTVLGFEGNAAKNYFACLPMIVANEDFAFKGRSARPPKDPFNSMLSFGYSLLYRDIIGAIERRGLHPYFAFMHKLKFGHAALASDLIEEYRAPIIDRTVIDLINDGEVGIDGFYVNDAGATYMTRETMAALTKRVSAVTTKGARYFAGFGDTKSYGFQAMLDRKLDMLITAIEQGEAGYYLPYYWRPQ